MLFLENCLSLNNNLDITQLGEVNSRGDIYRDTKLRGLYLAMNRP